MNKNPILTVTHWIKCVDPDYGNAGIADIAALPPIVEKSHNEEWCMGLL